MKTFRIGPISVVVSLAMLASLSVGIFWLAGPSAKNSFSADALGVESPALPESHQEYRAALRKLRTLAYKDQTIDACLRDLSQSLGIRIVLHESVLKFIHKDQTIELATTEPVSHQTAIRLVMQEVHWLEHSLVFADNQLTVVRDEDYHGPSLQTYDLMGRSDFSTAVRRREIAAMLTQVQPDSWNIANKTWVDTGESVYEIDVYQSQKVHAEIRKRLAPQQRSVADDKDEQSLSLSSLHKQKKAGKKLDKEAVVRRLRKKYAYASMAHRLKYEAARKEDDDPKLSAAMQKRIREEDKFFEDHKKGTYWFLSQRSESLRLLHEEEVGTFIKQAGFGFGRMPGPGAGYLPGNLPRDLPLASNEMIRSGDSTPIRLPETKTAAAARRVFLPSQQSLQELHQEGVTNFLSRGSFGYIKNRNEVAGFQSHGFLSAPRLLSHITRPAYRKKSHINRPSYSNTHPSYRKEKELWAMHRLELVSLLKHEKPAVYLSRSLPRMEELQNAKTRTLSRFEQSALDQLRKGEDVVTRASLNRIEMIGSLRATKQCQQCHEVKSGALLGAFSYELLRDPQLDPKKHREQDGVKPVF